MRAGHLWLGVRLLFGLLPTVVCAQDVPVARVGDRVRIWSGARRPQEGILRAVERETVFVQLAGGAPMATPLRAVTRVQRYAAPTHGAGARRGAKVGAIATIAAGLYLLTRDSACYSGGEEVPCPKPAEISVGGSIFVLTIGAGLGALAGSAVGAAIPVSSWREAQLPSSSGTATDDVACRGPATVAIAFPLPGRPRCAIASM